MWRLEVVVAGRAVGVYDVAPGSRLVVGRDPAADVVVAERSVSRRHCRLTGGPEGIEVADMGSANGVYQDGKPVQRVHLKQGDEVQIGMARLRLSAPPAKTGMIPVQGFLETTLARTEDSELPTGGSDGAGSAVLDVAKDEYKGLAKERLALLIEAGKSLSASLELEDLFERIMDLLFQILPVRRAVLVLKEDDGSLVPRHIRPSVEEAELSEVGSQHIVQQVIEENRPRIIDDASLDTGLNMAHSILAANIRAAICAPLTSSSRSIGALYADFPGRAKLYSQTDLDFFGAFASLCAVALENARLQTEVRERERLQRDLEIAGEIQMGLLPDGDMEAPGIDLDWVYWPSRHVGGDFYDCTIVDDERVALILGDVSGKSVGAALFMARLMSFLRATVPDNPAPGRVLTRTNALLGGRSDQVMFATACYVLYSHTRGLLSYASAGHLPALLLEPEAEQFRELRPTGIPLGIDPEYAYESQDCPVASGSLLTIYTDGILEGRDEKGVMFGLEAIKSIILERRDAAPKAITKALIDAVGTHCRGSNYTRDDIAILVVRLTTS